jgi:glyoxylase-like metal-dependent hydrolase (beta-lactamase superfamily II)
MIQPDFAGNAVGSGHRIHRALRFGLIALALMPVSFAFASPQSSGAPSGVDPAPVDFYRLAHGFVPESIGSDGVPMLPAFSLPNPWGAYTAYLISTNAKGQRTWRIENFLPGRNSSQGSTMYLLEGSHLALLIDTAQDTKEQMGTNDLKTLVRYLLGHTNLGGVIPHPVDFVVANTHNHGDHTGKNSQMSDRTVYYPELDWPTQAPAPPNYVPIKEGGGPGPHGVAVGKIDLGDREIEAVDIHEHTLGSTGYLDRENQMIATGDAIGSSYVWAQFGFITVYSQSVHHLQDVVRPYARLSVLPAHSYQNEQYERSGPPIYGRIVDKAYIDDQASAADGILNGQLVGVPYGLGRDTVWAKVKSASIVYSLANIYPQGKASAYNPIKLSGPFAQGGATANAALLNIQTELYMIHDSDTALFLLVGPARALLIGTGSGRPGLHDLAKRLAGKATLEVIVTSDDPDQVGGLSQFAAEKIFLPKGARGLEAGLQHVAFVTAGDKIDLGVGSTGNSVAVEVIPLAGHSSTALTLLDPYDHVLFGGDALGTQGAGVGQELSGTRPSRRAQSNPGGLVLHAGLAEFDRALADWRRKTDGKYDTLYTSHNFQWFTDPAYVDQLQSAVKRALANEAGAIVDSVYPKGMKMVGSGGAPDTAAAVIFEPAGAPVTGRSEHNH